MVTPLKIQAAYNSSQNAYTYQVDLFNGEYATGYFCLGIADRVSGGTYTEFPWITWTEKGYQGSNGYKREDVWLDHYGGAIMNGVRYDVREYIWITGGGSWFIGSAGNPVGRGADEDSRIHREFHFYQAGTLAGNNPVEVSFKVILQLTDMDRNEGYCVPANNLVRAFLSSNTSVSYRGSNTWVGTKDNDDNPFTNCAIWTEVHSEPGNPLHVQYLSYGDHGGDINYSPSLGTQATVNYHILTSSPFHNIVAPPSTQAAWYSNFVPSGAYGYEGYTFRGWFFDSSLTNSVPSSFAINTNTYNLYGTYYRNSYNLDVNPVKNGVKSGTGFTGCLFNVIVRDNGAIVGNLTKYNVTDYNTAIPYGCTYEIQIAGNPTGYTGYTTGNCSGTIRASSYEATPTWTANQYTLTFNGSKPSNATGTVSLSPTSKTVTYDSAIGGALPTPSLKGWTLSDSWKIDGTSISSGTIWNYAGSKTATVVWKANTYTIIYNKGSTDTAINVGNTACTYDSNVTLANGSNLLGRSYSITFNTNKPTSSSSTPSSVAAIAGNLSFNNWTTNVASSSGVNTFSSGQTLTKPNFVDGSSSNTVTATAIWNSKTVNNFASPTMTGYTFEGWYENVACTGNKITSITIDPGSSKFTKMLYAKWTPNKYTLNFDGSKPSNATSTVSLSPVSKTVTYDSAISTLPVPSLTGWTLDSAWKIDGNSIASSTIWKYLESKTANITWKANKYTRSYTKGLTDTMINVGDTICTYDSNVTLADGSSLLGRSYSILFDTNKPNYVSDIPSSVTSILGNLVFDKWVTDLKTNLNSSSGMNTFSSGQQLTKPNFVDGSSSNQVTATATWSNKTVTNFTEPTLKGFRFSGWMENAVGTGNKVTSITITPSNSKFNKTLYAMWERDIILRFDLNGGTYKGSSDTISLKGTVYNNQPDYTFNINDNLTQAVPTKYNTQINKINAYGTYNINGENSLYKKINNGVVYRFLGWSLNPDATQPDINLDVFSNQRSLEYTVSKYTVLYAVWEPVLQMNFKFTLAQIIHRIMITRMMEVYLQSWMTFEPN